jgi:hypothetical protein
MFSNIAATVIAAAITGLAGYLIKAFLTRNRYLPSSREDPKAYSFINGPWFFYHFTCDVTSRTVLSVDRASLKLERDQIIVGTAEAVVENRSALHYNLRGEIRAGQLFLTGVCAEDPSDAYTCIFPNLLNDVSSGVMIARDYARRLYASATVMTQRRIPDSEAEKILRQSDVRLYGWLPTSGSAT